MTQNITRIISKNILYLLVILISVACDNQEVTDSASLYDHIIARADSLELDTEYVAPPGNALEHHTSGFAKILC